MPVRVVFRCQFCSAAPDAETQVSLERDVRSFAFGQYVDALPGRWLIWHGHGLLGPVRYACPDHRGDLVAFLREAYGTVSPHPWKRPPYPHSVRTPDSERAFRQKMSGKPGYF